MTRTGERIGTYAEAGAEEADRGVAAALKTFRETPWREDRRLRAKAINEMADVFEAATDGLVEILSLENGKVKARGPVRGRDGAGQLRFYAALALTDYRRAMETAPDRYTQVLREPMGVAGILAPWNSPVVLFIRSLAPALAAGCTVVGKLPGLTAQTNNRMNELFAKVTNLPMGVMNMLTEGGSAAARRIVEHPDVPTISLADLDPLEPLGKPTAHLVENGTVDQQAAAGHTELTGEGRQRLLDHGQRLVEVGVVEQDHRGLATELAAEALHFRRAIGHDRLARLRTAGPASDASSEMGPIIDKPNVERIDKLVEQAIAQGAKVVVRGGPVAEGPLARGAFFRPTLLEIADHSLPIAQDEVFGPVLAMQAFHDEAGWKDRNACNSTSSDASPDSALAIEAINAART